MKNMLGDTVDPELAEICVLCGMVANMDPFLHADRYGHQPEVIRDGVQLRHNGRGAFTIKVDD